MVSEDETSKHETVIVTASEEMPTSTKAAPSSPEQPEAQSSTTTATSDTQPSDLSSQKQNDDRTSEDRALGKKEVDSVNFQTTTPAPSVTTPQLTLPPKVGAVAPGGSPIILGIAVVDFVSNLDLELELEKRRGTGGRCKECG